jgi:hypothetical protein
MPEALTHARPIKTNSVIQHSSSHQQRRRKKADKRAKPFGSAGREFSEESKIMRFCPELVELCTTAAERQDPDFLIGPRNKKKRKKRSTIKILYSPVQITNRDF